VCVCVLSSLLEFILVLLLTQKMLENYFKCLEISRKSLSLASVNPDWFYLSGTGSPG